MHHAGPAKWIASFAFSTLRQQQLCNRPIRSKKINFSLNDYCDAAGYIFVTQHREYQRYPNITLYLLWWMGFSRLWAMCRIVCMASGRRWRWLVLEARLNVMEFVNLIVNEYIFSSLRWIDLPVFSGLSHAICRVFLCSSSSAQAKIWTTKHCVACIDVNSCISIMIACYSCKNAFSLDSVWFEAFYEFPWRRLWHTCTVHDVLTL